MARRRNVHKSGLTPLTPPEQMAKKISENHLRRTNLPPARRSNAAAPPAARKTSPQKPQKPAAKKTQKKAAPPQQKTPRKNPPVSRSKAQKAQGAPQGSKLKKNQPQGEPVAKKTTPPTPAQKKQAAEKSPRLPIPQPTAKPPAQDHVAQDKHPTQPQRPVRTRGGAHRKEKESQLYSFFAPWKKKKDEDPAFTVEEQPTKGSAYLAEDKEKSHVKADKKRNIIDTSYDPKRFEEKFSTDSIDEAKEKAKLSDNDVKSIYGKVTENVISQQVRSNGKSVQPLPKIVVIQPRKKKIFKFFTSLWTVLLIIAATVLCGYGYKVWTDSELSKEKDEAYALGVSTSGVDPDISSVMKLDSGQLQNLVVNAQGVTMPDKAVLSNYSLVGWSIPGGNNTEGKTEVSFCYSGEGVRGTLQGSAFFFTPDAQSTNPEWTVDTVALTQVPCSGNR